MAIQPLKSAERKVPTGERSVAEGARRPLVLQANGDPWMGPGEAPRSSVPPGNEPRAWEYPLWFNASQDPRGAKSYEAQGISFNDLRAMANQAHVRAALETVKNTQCKKEWVFALKAMPGERSIEVRARADKDRRLGEIAEFFESPDGENDLAEWLRMYMEDMLVLDAPTVYNVQRRDGKPFELEIFDGSTIRPLLAPDGRRPRGYDASGRREPAYQQWLYGAPGDKFSVDEMMYAPRNPRPGKAFGFSPVEQLTLYINIALRKDLQRLHTYTDGNIPAGLLPMPADFKSHDIATWYSSFNTFVKGVAQNQVKIIPIPGGTGQPIFPSLESNKDQWEESWIRLVCFAFDISVQSLVKEMNKATAAEARDAADQDGAAAYTDYIRRRLNWIIRNWFGYRDIEAKPKQELDVEAEKQAEIDERRLKTGLDQLNELRERDGKAPIAELEGVNGYFTAKGFVAFLPAGANAEPDAGDGDTDAAALLVGKETDPGKGPSGTAAGAAAAVASVELNGAQMTAATQIVINVANGTLPRDSGLNQLQILFKMTPAEADLFMGSAGNPSVATTPNPIGGRPDPEDDPDSTPPTPPRAPLDETETEKAEHEYQSTQLNLPRAIAKKVLRMAAGIPDEVLHAKGREDTPHITIKFGIGLEVTADEVREAINNSDSVREIRDRGGIAVTLGKTSHFEGKEFDVVFIAVESADLEILNTAIARGVESTDTQSEYVPHVTLAYVEKGRGADFDGDDKLAGTKLMFDSFEFSDVDGNFETIDLVKESKKAAPTLARPELVAKRSKGLTRKIARFLAKSAGPIADDVASRYAEQLKANEFEITLDWDDLVEAIVPSLSSIYEDGVEAAATDLGTSPFRRVSVAAGEWARERAAELVGKKWVDGELVDNPNARWSITDSTRSELRRLVEKATRDGLTPDDLKKAIRESTTFSESRAKNVADYELAAAQEAGSLEMWEESGVVEKKGWLLSNDHQEYDDCNRNAEAGEIPVDELFPSGHMTGPAHPRCDCSVYAVVA